ncbi:class I SAM-dependent methyltransferase [Sphingobacterium sp.]|uniref:class I SAM-dependent methyltransferase n=2 Tax=unclassified Sphingobacterium TaxID=2609468 RepID=UPI0028A639D8|nr:class I SAM-dependent methyltransferase [Sphingobacterium sp.]
MKMKNIASYWDKQSVLWREEKEEAWNTPVMNRWVDFFRSLRTQEIHMGNKMLEIGTASGYFANIITKAEFDVTAIDLSPLMIREAEAVSNQLKLSVNYKIMDAQQLTFADGEFDFIFTRLMTWTIPDLLKCYQEAFRVLKPGGVFLNFDGDFGQTIFTQEGHERYPAAIMEEANTIKSKLDISKYKRPEKDIELLQKAGFSTIRTDWKTQQYIETGKDDADSTLFYIHAIKTVQ